MSAHAEHRSPRVAWTAGLSVALVGSLLSPAQESATARLPRVLIAPPAADTPGRIDLFREELRFRAWLDRDDNRARVTEDPRVALEFGALDTGLGGALNPDVRWIPHVREGLGLDPFSMPSSLSTSADATTVRLLDGTHRGSVRVSGGRFVEFVAVDVGGEHFTGADLERSSIDVRAGADGRPGLSIELGRERRAAFERWTRARVDSVIVLAVEGSLASAPRVLSPIAGAMVVDGAFDEGDLRTLAERMRAGELELDVARRPTTPESIRALSALSRRIRDRTAAARSALTFDELAAWATDDDAPDAREDVVLIGFPYELAEENESTELLLVESPWETSFGGPPGPERVVHLSIAVDRPPRLSAVRGRALRVTGHVQRRDAPAPDGSTSSVARVARFRMTAARFEFLEVGG